jgi:hypothetical protein
MIIWHGRPGEVKTSTGAGDSARAPVRNLMSVAVLNSVNELLHRTSQQVSTSSSLGIKQNTPTPGRTVRERFSLSICKKRIEKCYYEEAHSEEVTRFVF